MIVEFFSVFGFVGAFGMAFRFDLFISEIIRKIAMFLSHHPSQWIVVSSSDRRDFVASFGVRIRPPRKPPDKFRHLDLRRVRSPIDC